MEFAHRRLKTFFFDAVYEVAVSLTFVLRDAKQYAVQRAGDDRS